MSLELYSEIILDHYKNPKNKGKMADATISIEEDNPLCGDKIQIHLKISSNGKDKTATIEKITFDGEGCAISQATASMLTAELQGKPLKDLENMGNEDIFEMLKIPISPGRMKCALLALIAAKKAGILAKAEAKY